MEGVPGPGVGWGGGAEGESVSLELTGHPSLLQCMRPSASTCFPSVRPPSSSMRTWCTSFWALLVRLLFPPPTSYQLLFLPPDLGVERSTLLRTGAGCP